MPSWNENILKKEISNSNFPQNGEVNGARKIFYDLMYILAFLFSWHVNEA